MPIGLSTGASLRELVKCVEAKSSAPEVPMTIRAMTTSACCFVRRLNDYIRA